MKVCRAIKLLCVLLSIALVSCGGHKDKLLGTWQSNHFQDGARFSMEVTYHKNGTYSGSGTISGNGQEVYLVLSGKWELDGDLINEEVTSSNIPGFIPVGYTDSSEIISLSDRTLEVGTSAGIIVYTRK